MPQLTEWLKLMVAEINRKREDAEAAKKEDTARKNEAPAPQTHANRMNKNHGAS